MRRPNAPKPGALAGSDARRGHTAPCFCGRHGRPRRAHSRARPLAAVPGAQALAVTRASMSLCSSGEGTRSACGASVRGPACLPAQRPSGSWGGCVGRRGRGLGGECRSPPQMRRPLALPLQPLVRSGSPRHPQPARSPPQGERGTENRPAEPLLQDQPPDASPQHRPADQSPPAPHPRLRTRVGGSVPGVCGGGLISRPAGGRVVLAAAPGWSGGVRVWNSQTPSCPVFRERQVSVEART